MAADPIVLRPGSAEEVLDGVRWAGAQDIPLEIIGHGTKRQIGRPVQAAAEMDLSGLSGINFYEPEELVISVKAGTPLSEVKTLLFDNHQELQFEPMDYGPLFGETPGRGTMGGVLASNLSGPRRLKAGAARDHVLGVHAVSGRGEAFKSGGRVVKNVTGYDLSKGLAGSWGTLAVVTDLVFKVLPKAETEQTLVLRGLTDDDASRAMAAAMGSAAEVSSAAHLPQGLADGLAGGALGARALTALRLEGFEQSVAYRAEQLSRLLADFAKGELIDPGMSADLWQDISNVRSLAEDPQKPLWRVSIAPMAGHQLVAALQESCAFEAYYDWQGGLVWLQMEDGDENAPALRQALKNLGGGHATLVRASHSARAAIPVFQPQAPALAALSGRLKEQFDPKHLLNPGRMSCQSA